MPEVSLDFRLSHILRVFFVVKANILQTQLTQDFQYFKHNDESEKLPATGPSSEWIFARTSVSAHPH